VMALVVKESQLARVVCMVTVGNRL